MAICNAGEVGKVRLEAAHVANVFFAAGGFVLLRMMWLGGFVVDSWGGGVVGCRGFGRVFVGFNLLLFG